MNQKEIKELIDYLVDKDISEFELERGDVKLRVKRGSAPAVIMAAAEAHNPAVLPAQVATVPLPSPVAAAQPAPAPPTSAPPPSTTEGAEEAGLHMIRSPIVGTFYESPSPGAPAFVKAGDTVSAGQVLCIIEAMKLMNEIESDYSGEIVKRYVSNAQPVEYGQPLFAIRAQ